MKKIALFCLSILLLTTSAFALEKEATQNWTIFCFSATDNFVRVGEAANITGSVWIDGVENVIDDTNPTELANGYYVFDITQVESNGENISIDPSITTADIQCIGCPMALWTRPPNHSDMDIDPTNGQVDSNLTHIGGDAQSATDLKDFADAGYDPTNDRVVKVYQLTELDEDNTTIDLDGTTVASATNVATVGNDVGITQAGADKVWNTVTRILTALDEDDTTIDLDGSTVATATNVATVGNDVGITQAAADKVWSTTSDLTDTMKASINAEMVDVYTIDTIQEATDILNFSATPTAQACDRLQYMINRNKTVTDEGEHRLYNDAGTVILEYSISYATPDFTRSELRND
jgi:hypothetical protein